MFPYLILLFTVLPAIELMVLIKVGTIIGAFNTFFIIIFTGVLGAYLARIQGFIVLMKIQENINRGQMPSSELLDGVMILTGGILLLTPGFVTDTLGFILLIPMTRAIIKYWISKKFESMINNGQIINIRTFNRKDNSTDDFIDIN